MPEMWCAAFIGRSLSGTFYGRAWLYDTGSARAALDGLTDADLAKPISAEGDMKEWFGTIAQRLAATPVHHGFHGGQIADARRAAGRAVLMGDAYDFFLISDLAIVWRVNKLPR